MTKVSLKRRDGEYRVECTGHATGSAEVCAAASCLCETLGQWLQQDRAAEGLEKRLEPGDVVIRFRGGTEAETAFRLVRTGFLSLEATDPKRICVEEEQ